MTILETQHHLWPDEEACAHFAQALAQCPQLQNLSIELHGELGAGKTTFVRHLLRALGVQGRIKSPSYAVVEPYQPPLLQGLSAHHFDFYRFSDPREWEDAGFRDIFAAPGLKLCEWPQKAAGVLPTPDLKLVLTLDLNDARLVRLQAHSAQGQQVLAQLEALLSRYATPPSDPQEPPL
ncbi:tRNA (adenosine(37)-N6)-threonylcarbamoyltransferase complex ATPase subunit type 1 TsaE [Roseateles sp. BYS180W]|uniref:tRNA threonylcarbamoyladenosine biosynthesis protein TsaE n=1 Tax=Roseateles rivi TaxID=3299028 RepID=A0ABW7FZL9_9BURK